MPNRPDQVRPDQEYGLTAFILIMRNIDICNFIDLLSIIPNNMQKNHSNILPLNYYFWLFGKYLYLIIHNILICALFFRFTDLFIKVSIK